MTHLATEAAGGISRMVKVTKLKPVHFSPLHDGEEERLPVEVAAAFQR